MAAVGQNGSSESQACTRRRSWVSDRNNNSSWVDEAISADELSLISLEDGDSEQVFSISRYKKRVTFVADEHLVSIRSISPRSSSPTHAELNSSDAVDVEPVEDDKAVTIDLSAPAACRAARRSSKLIYNRLMAATSSKMSSIYVDTQHQPRPPAQPHPFSRSRPTSADSGNRPDSASSSFAVTKRRIDRYISATRPLAANSYRRKAGIAPTTNTSQTRPLKPRQLIEINMKGLNNGNLLFRPVLAKSCPDLATASEINGGGGSRLSQPQDRWCRTPPARGSGGPDKTKVYAWQMANGSVPAVVTPSIVPLYGLGASGSRPFSAS